MGKDNDKLIEILQRQLEHSNKQNDELQKRIEVLTEQVRHLTNALNGS
ncbi:hypothetical protein [Pseudogracilibacillus sp. SO30301A]